MPTIKYLPGRSYSQSPILRDMYGRMVEMFGDNFVDTIFRSADGLRRVVSASMSAYYRAVQMRQNIGGELHAVVVGLPDEDRIRDLMEGRDTAGFMRQLLAEMPAPVGALLSSFSDEYEVVDKGKVPVGRVSSAVDETCVLTFAAAALDLALMDFQPANPQDSPLVREVSNLTESSKKVLIIAGPPAVGRDSVLEGFLKMKLGRPIAGEIERSRLLKLAEGKGIHRLIKLTTRPRRGGEFDGVDLHFFDGGDLLTDSTGHVVYDSMIATPLRDGTRPIETELLALRILDSPLAYSYQYNRQYYAFPSRNIDPTVSSKPDVIKGLKEMLENPDVKMIILKSGTTPEVLYLTKLLPNATTAYIVPEDVHQSIATQEREIRARWFSRELKGMQSIIEHRGKTAWPADFIGYAHQIEEQANARMVEIIPHMVMGLVCDKHVPGFHVIPNLSGVERLSYAAVELDNILKRSRKFPDVYTT